MHACECLADAEVCDQDDHAGGHRRPAGRNGPDADVCADQMGCASSFVATVCLVKEALFFPGRCGALTLLLVVEELLPIDD